MRDERTRAVVLSSGVGVAQRVAQVLATLVTYPLLTRALGVGAFGVWGAATSLVWIAWMLDLGLGNALVTLIPNALAGRGRAAAADLVGAGLSCTLGLSTLILAAGVFALAVAHGRIDPAFVVAGAALALNLPLGLAARLWLSLQKGYVASAWELVQTVLTAGLLVGGALGGWSTSALVACVFGGLVAANAGALVHLMLSHPELRPRRAFDALAFRQLAANGGPMLAISVALAAMWAFDNVLVLAWLGAAAAASMAIALRLCTTAQGVIGVIAQSFWPAFADATEDRAWAKRALIRGTLMLTGLSLAGSIALAAIGAPLLKYWLGRDLGVDSAMLWAVGAWVTSFALVQTPLFLLLAVSRLCAPLIALTTAAVLGLGVKAVAAHALGPAGFLAATAAVNLLIVLPACAWSARSWLYPNLAEPQQGLE